MASEIRVNTINNRSGLGTISITNSGAVFSGVTTFAQIQTTSGEVTVGTGASVYSPATNVLALGTNNAERVRINSSGFVGIGSQSPISTLDISESDSASVTSPILTLRQGTGLGQNAMIRLTGHINDTTGLRFRQNGNGNNVDKDSSIFNELSGALILGTNNLERLRITSAGKVGINTESPRAVLDIEGNAENAILMLHSTDLNANLQFSDNTGGARILNYGGDLAFRTGTNADVFGTGDTEKLRITSGGNVGIGTDNPSTNIHIYDSSQPTIRLDRSDAPRNNFVAAWNADELVLAADHANAGSASRIRFFVDSDEKVRIDDNGNIVMVNSGTGIDFSAASGSAAGSSSAVLDDYEEGTFTPIDSSGAGLTLTEARGHYVKVGNVVHCQVRVVWPSQANSNNAVIGGFPFNANNPSDVSNGAVPSGFGYISSGSVIPQIHKTGGDDTTYFYNFSAAMTNANFSGIQVRFGVTYRTS